MGCVERSSANLLSESRRLTLRCLPSPVCFPYFDSPSVFARLLDKDIGGHFSMTPLADNTHSKQQYLPNSAIISTKFLSDEGVCTVTDFMPRPSPNAKVDKPLLPWLVRRVEVIRGTLTFRMECFPAFDYARQSHQTTLVDDERCEKDRESRFRKKAVFKSDIMTLELRAITGFNTDLAPLDNDSKIPEISFQTDTSSWPRHKGPGISAVFELEEGMVATFILREDPATAEPVQAVPSTKTPHTNKAPVQIRDGPHVLTKTFPAQNVDPVLDDKLVRSLLDAVSQGRPRERHGR